MRFETKHKLPFKRDLKSYFASNKKPFCAEWENKETYRVGEETYGITIQAPTPFSVDKNTLVHRDMNRFKEGFLSVERGNYTFYGSIWQAQAVYQSVWRFAIIQPFLKERGFKSLEERFSAIANEFLELKHIQNKQWIMCANHLWLYFENCDESNIASAYYLSAVDGERMVLLQFNHLYHQLNENTQRLCFNTQQEIFASHQWSGSFQHSTNTLDKLLYDQALNAPIFRSNPRLSRVKDELANGLYRCVYKEQRWQIERTSPIINLQHLLSIDGVGLFNNTKDGEPNKEKHNLLNIFIPDTSKQPDEALWSLRRDEINDNHIIFPFSNICYYILWTNNKNEMNERANVINYWLEHLGQLENAYYKPLVISNNKASKIVMQFIKHSRFSYINALSFYFIDLNVEDGGAAENKLSKLRSINNYREWRYSCYYNSKWLMFSYLKKKLFWFSLILIYFWMILARLVNGIFDTDIPDSIFSVANIQSSALPIGFLLFVLALEAKLTRARKQRNAVLPN